MKKIGKWLICVLLVMMMGVASARAMDFGGYQTGAKALALYNLRDGSLLASENADEKMAVASLTKMMVAIAVLEDTELELTDTVTVTNAMLANLTGWSVAGLKAGMTPSVEELLYMLMLPSGGDAGQVLAVAASGSLDDFAKVMNQKAEALVLTNTHFSNPIGRDEDNYSTARDMAALLMHALENEKFRQVFEANSYDSATLGKKIYKTVDLTAKGLTGAKTGFTYAGRSLASTASRGGVEYLLVVLDADWRTTKHIDDSLAIYKYYGENYGYLELISEDEVLLTLPVIDAEESEYEVKLGRFEYYMARDYEVESLEYEFEGVEEVTRRLGAGDLIGTLRIRKDGEEIYRQEVYLEAEINYHLPIWQTAVIAGVAIVAVVLVWVLAKKKWMKIVVTVVAVAGATAGLCLLWIPATPGWSVREVPREEFTWAESVAVVGETIPESAETVPGSTSSGSSGSSSGASSSKTNCSLSFGKLMLINPKWPVTTSWIANRRSQLVNIYNLYGIVEGNSANGAPLMDAEAASHLAEMIAAYKEAYPGHTIETRSCFRSKGTSCGRLCYATGTSDHHSGYTCDLIDPAYGTVLDTSRYGQHIEWQWLKANSYKYGFIDRFPQEWAGGPMSQPVNITEAGSTGLYETWHYRYVGVEAAKEIATGKYNNGAYDSLEHYLKASGRISSLLGFSCS